MRFQWHAVFRLTRAAQEGFLAAICLLALPAAAQSYSVLHFLQKGDATEGANPFGNLAWDGNKLFLYGTTANGGASGNGTVFRVKPDGSQFETVYAFSGVGSIGSSPESGLVWGDDGNFYGTTVGGGTSGLGTVYRITACVTTPCQLTTLRSFLGASDGYLPGGPLAFDGSFLYGTTAGGGGAFGKGTVFLVSPNGAGFETIYTFSGGNSDGAVPAGGLLSLGGFLYGTTTGGGPDDLGTVFKIGTNGALQWLAPFVAAVGEDPQGGLIDGGGVLYGTAEGGGLGSGTIFSVKKDDGTALKAVHKFSFLVGTDPFGRLFKSGAYLYGTLAFGGPLGSGAIFEWDTTEVDLTKGIRSLHQFFGYDGRNSRSGLVQDADGFYGTTLTGGFGGPFGPGVVFKLTLANGPAPTVTGITPTTGPDTGGTPVTITGTGFQPGATVRLGSALADPATWKDEQTIEAVTPADSGAGLVDVIVRNPDGQQGILSQSFTYTGGCVPPTAVAFGDASICLGGSTKLRGQGGTSCAWSPTGGLSSPSDCNPTANPPTTTPYTLTVTDANGCVSTNPAIVTVTVNALPTPPTITQTSGTNPSCAGTAVTLDAGAGYDSYLWSTGAATRTITVSPSSNANYSVTGTTAGCTSTQGRWAQTVNPVPAAPVVTQKAGSNPSCAGASITLDAGAGYDSYAWSNGANTRTITVSPPMSGSYSVTGTTAGCTSVAGGWSQTVNSVPSTPSAFNTGPYCPGTAISLSLSAGVTPGATYNWTGPNGFSTSSTNATITITNATPAMAGTYSVTATVNGCASASAGTTLVDVHPSCSAARVFVATQTGVDAGRICTDISNPCKTLPYALSQVDPGGEVILVESGAYDPVTIAKSTRIIAPAGVSALFSTLLVDAVTVDAVGSTVVLDGLNFRGGPSHGIVAANVGQLFVERCTISGFIVDGIHFAAAGGTLFMSDDDVRENGQSGVVVTGSAVLEARAVIRESIFADNVVAGVLAGPDSFVSVTDSVAAGNFFGFVAEAGVAAPADLTLDGVQAIFNGTGLSAEASVGSAPTLRFSKSLVTLNKIGLSIGAGSTVLSPGTSVVERNVITDVSGGAITLLTPK